MFERRRQAAISDGRESDGTSRPSIQEKVRYSEEQRESRWLPSEVDRLWGQRVHVPRLQ